MNPSIEAPDCSEPTYVGFYSAPKAFGLTAVLLFLGVAPLVPGFSDGLAYRAFFYTAVGYQLLLAACAMMLFLAVAMLPFGIRALWNSPGIEVRAGSIRIYGLRARDYSVSFAYQTARKEHGSLLMRSSEGKEFTVPLWLYQDPDEVLAHLPAVRD